MWVVAVRSGATGHVNRLACIPALCSHRLEGLLEHLSGGLVNRIAGEWVQRLRSTMVRCTLPAGHISQTYRARFHANGENTKQQPKHPPSPGRYDRLYEAVVLHVLLVDLLGTRQAKLLILLLLRFSISGSACRAISGWCAGAWLFGHCADGRCCSHEARLSICLSTARSASNSLLASPLPYRHMSFACLLRC
jgi:hypothetical protein